MPTLFKSGIRPKRIANSCGMRSPVTGGRDATLYGSLAKKSIAPALQAADSGFNPRSHHQYPGIAQVVEREIWDFEAASASLATWTKFDFP